MWASMNGMKELARELLALGADPTVKDLVRFELAAYSCSPVKLSLTHPALLCLTVCVTLVFVNPLLWL